MSDSTRAGAVRALTPVGHKGGAAAAEGRGQCDGGGRCCEEGAACATVRGRVASARLVLDDEV